MVDSKGQQTFSCKYLDNKYFRVAGHLRFPSWLKFPIAVLKEATDNAWMKECGSVPVQFYLQKMKPLQGTIQTLTRDSQHLRLTVNVQIELSGSILQDL